MSILQRIFGGWKTWGPNRISGDGALSSGSHNADRALYPSVNEDTALTISAMLACLRLRSETHGSLPLHLRDDKKNLLQDHDLYGLLKYSPNSLQTGAEFWSQQNAIRDMHGNALVLIERRSNGSVLSLEPFGQEASCNFSIKQRRTGAYYYNIMGEEYDPERVFHLKGFGMDGLTGLGMLAAGRAILEAQISANNAALLSFKNGLKIGGFLLNKGSQNWTKEQIEDIDRRLRTHSLPENAGKMMSMLIGMEPVSGEKFTVNPVDAQLLESRYFGIEEVCRLANVPPQLIGHTDKASSWASSLENVNLHFLMYSMTPTLVRDEARILKSLIPRKDWGKVEAKFSVQGLLRSDLKSRTEFYASGLQNGYLCRDEVRDFEERASIPGGDKFTVQTNMVDVDKLPEAGQGNDK